MWRELSLVGNEPVKEEGAVCGAWQKELFVCPTGVYFFLCFTWARQGLGLFLSLNSNPKDKPVGRTGSKQSWVQPACCCLGPDMQLLLWKSLFLLPGLQECSCP